MQKFNLQLNKFYGFFLLCCLIISKLNKNFPSNCVAISAVELLHVQSNNCFVNSKVELQVPSSNRFAIHAVELPVQSSNCFAIHAIELPIQSSNCFAISAVELCVQSLHNIIMLHYGVLTFYVPDQM